MHDLLARASEWAQVGGLLTTLETIADGCADAMADSSARAELCRALVHPLLEGATCELLGVPIDDQLHVRHWVGEAARGSTASTRDRDHARMVLDGYLCELVESRFSGPPAKDLVSTLRHSHHGAGALDELGVLRCVEYVVSRCFKESARRVTNVVRFCLFNWSAPAEPRMTPAVIADLLQLHAVCVVAPRRRASTRIDLGEITIPAGARVILAAEAAAGAGGATVRGGRADSGDEALGGPRVSGRAHPAGWDHEDLLVSTGLSSLLLRFPDLELVESGVRGSAVAGPKPGDPRPVFVTWRPARGALAARVPATSAPGR